MARPASPPPVAGGPDPAGATPDPGSGYPYRVNERGHDVCAWHPDILDAVPAPVARLPDIAGNRWRGHRLDHRSGWGKADHNPDAGKAGSGERHRQGAENGKDQSSAHGEVPGKHLASAKQPTDRDGSVLDGRQYVPAFLRATRPLGARIDQSAARLAREGESEPIHIEETDTTFAIGWKGRYRLEGPAFIYTDQDTGRVATILGYPTDKLSQIG